MRYRNPWSHDSHNIVDILRWKFSAKSRNAPVGQPAAFQAITRHDFAQAPVDVWRCWWLGHASFLLQIRGLNVLIDPIFSDFCSPIPLAGLRRHVAPPCLLDDLPKIDAILLTHSHYDHLCLKTLRALPGDPDVFLPVGHAKWMKKNTYLRNLHELEWWQSQSWKEGLTIHALPAQHFTARGLMDRNKGHWCGWMIDSPKTRVWHAGDTAYCPAFREIGERFSGINLAMLPIGAYAPRNIMRSMHMNPTEAVRAYIDAQCRKAVAMHWGTFRLTDEPLDEPPRLLRQALEEFQLTEKDFLCMAVGEHVDVPSGSV